MAEIPVEQAEWLYRVARAVGGKDKTIAWEKLMLFKRGLKSGSIYFKDGQPAVKLPDWYFPLACKKKWSRAEEKRMLAVVEERQAYYYLINELQP